MLKLSDPSLFREACFVDGQWIQAASGKRIAVTDKATGKVIGHVPSLSKAEVAKAIQAADRARLAGGAGPPRSGRRCCAGWPT